MWVSCGGKGKKKKKEKEKRKKKEKKVPHAQVLMRAWERRMAGGGVEGEVGELWGQGCFFRKRGAGEVG